MRRAEAGQVLVMIALLLVVLLGFAAFAVDIGRQLSERRHVQNAADAAALAACRSLIAGDSDAAAAADARAVALINLEGSPTGTSGSVAADGSPEYSDGHAGDPAYLTSGILINGTTVRVAIDSQVPTTLARVVGISQLDAGARARCRLQGGPAVPIVARRYVSAPGPNGGFTDFVATSGTRDTGSVDATNAVDGATGLVGYLATGRTPASEGDPGPTFDLYGPGAKASNASDFRGFIALDVRNFEDASSRVYYNGVAAGTNVQTLKNMQGAYIRSGYPGPMFPPVTSPADPNDQVAVISGNDTSMVVGNFSDSYGVGDRILLAIYNGTVMEIPDFAISPPASFAVATTGTLANGPSFVVSRNDSFNSTVTLHLHGDLEAAAAGHPEYDLVPDPPVTPPAAGDMNQPTWSTDVFIPAKNGTTVRTSNIQANAVPAGIYTVWLEGHSGNPYFQTRRVPVPVKVGAANRDFRASELNAERQRGHARREHQPADLRLDDDSVEHEVELHEQREPHDRAVQHLLVRGREHPAGPDLAERPSGRAELERLGRAVDDDDQHRGPGAELLPIRPPRHGHERRRPAGHPPPADHLHRRHHVDGRQLRRHHRLRRLRGDRCVSQLHHRPRRQRRLCRSQRRGVAACAGCAPHALVTS